MPLPQAIAPPDAAILPDLRQKLANKIKPEGALGRLESLACQVGHVQQSRSPRLQHPRLMLFAADHGLAAATSVSAYPQQITAEMLQHFLAADAAVNIFCRTNGLHCQVINAGIASPPPFNSGLLDYSMGPGTRNMLLEPAMTQAECQTALEKGYQLARAASREGSNVLALGEMGIGNSSAAALLVSKLLPAPLASCIGPGTGLAGEALTGKQIVLEQVLAQHEEATSPLAVLAAVGGFELAMMAGAFIGGAEQGMVLLVDGFIASASWLAAERLCPGLLPYSVLAHLAAEPGHQVLIDAMALPQPLLQLDLRLGEGSGAALAYPLLRSAVAMLNELAPFDSRAEA